MKKLFFIIALFIPVSGWAQAITLVGSTAAGSTNGTSVAVPNAGSPTSALCTTSSCNTAGSNLIVVTAEYFGTSVTPCSSQPGQVVADNFGNVYTQGPDFVGNASTVSVTSYYAVNPTVGAGHTWSCSSGGSQFMVLNVAFFNNGAAKDQSAGTVNTTASITTIQPGSVTPTKNNEVLVLGCASNDGTVTTFSADSSMIKLSDIPAAASASVHGAQFYLIQTTAAAVNPTCTNSASTAAGLGATILTFQFGGNLPGTAGNSSFMLTGVGR